MLGKFLKEYEGRLDMTVLKSRLDSKLSISKEKGEPEEHPHGTFKQLAIL